jgi:tetratricopeptide (TPR) repeat protein
LEGYLMLGRVRHLLGETQAAQEALRQAILIEPDYYEGRLELARVLFETRVPLTEQAAAQPAASAPEQSDPAVLPGIGSSRRSESTQSAQSSAPVPAPALPGDAPDALVQAAEHIAQARRVRPDALEALLLQTRILVAQGHLSDAQYVTEQALARSPSQLELLRVLMDVQRQRANWAQVAETLARIRQAGELAPEDEIVRADYLEGSGDTAGAAALRADLVRRHPRNAAVLVAGARGLLAQNQPREALTAAERAVEAAPRRAEAHYWKAVAHFALGENLDGDLALNRAEALEGGNSAIRLLRIRRLMSERRLGEAAPRMQRYVVQFPADRAGLLLQAELATLLGDHGEAERLLALLPANDPGVRFALARLDYLRGRHAGVLTALAPLTALPSPPWEAVYLEASALARLGRIEEALEKVRPRVDRDSGGAAFARLAGMLAHQGGDARTAERYYQQGLRRFPRDAGLLEGISRIAVEREDWRAARPWLEAGAERPGPFQPLMLERLALVYRKLGEQERAKDATLRYLATIDPLVREGREATDPAILYRMTLPTLGLALDAR